MMERSWFEERQGGRKDRQYLLVSLLMTVNLQKLSYTGNLKVYNLNCLSVVSSLASSLSFEFCTLASEGEVGNRQHGPIGLRVTQEVLDSGLKSQWSEWKSKEV